MLEKRLQKNNEIQKLNSSNLASRLSYNQLCKASDGRKRKQINNLNNDINNKNNIINIKLNLNNISSKNEIRQHNNNLNINQMQVSKITFDENGNNKQYITKRMEQIRNKYSFNPNLTNKNEYIRKTLQQHNNIPKDENGDNKIQQSHKYSLNKSSEQITKTQIKQKYNQKQFNLHNVERNLNKSQIQNNQHKKKIPIYINNFNSFGISDTKNNKSKSVLDKFQRQFSKTIGSNPFKQSVTHQQNLSQINIIADPRIESIDKINEKIKTILKNTNNNVQQSKTKKSFINTFSTHTNNQGLQKQIVQLNSVDNILNKYNQKQLQKNINSKCSFQKNSTNKIIGSENNQQKKIIQNKKQLIKVQKQIINQNDKFKRSASITPIPINKSITFGKDIMELRQKYSVKKKQQQQNPISQQKYRISSISAQKLHLKQQKINYKFKSRQNLLTPPPESHILNINALKLKFQKSQKLYQRPKSEYQPNIPPSDTRQKSQQQSVVIRRTFFNKDNQIDNKQYNQVKPQIKKLLFHLKKQVQLDQNYRNKKSSFKLINNNKQKNQLLNIFKQININCFESQQQLLKQIQITQSEYNPFYTFRQQSYIQDLAYAFKKSKQYWDENIKQKYNYSILIEKQQIKEQIIGFNKKGYLQVEDLVRFLNNANASENGVFYRNRDLILIFRRFCGGDLSCNKIKFEQFIEILCGKMNIKKDQFNKQQINSKKLDEKN